MCIECTICCRNSRYLEKTFQPTAYLGIQLKEPIDMYISKEHYNLILKKMEQMNADKVIIRWPWPNIDVDFTPWPVYTFLNGNTTTYSVQVDPSNKLVLSQGIDIKIEDPKKRKLRGK